MKSNFKKIHDEVVRIFQLSLVSQINYTNIGQIDPQVHMTILII